MPQSTLARVAVGFLAAVLSVLVFHQGIILVLSSLGMLGIPRNAPVWNLAANPRAFGLPSLFNLCFWGGLYGAAFGLLAPRFRWPLWVCGILTGVAAVLVGIFVVTPLRGASISDALDGLRVLRSLVINGIFGLGIGLIYPFALQKLAPPALGRR